MDQVTRMALVVVAQAVVGVILYRKGAVLVKRCARPTADAYEEGHDAGFDRGWREGRRADRPAIVPLT